MAQEPGWETVKLREPCPKCGNKICGLLFMFPREGFVFAVWKCFACGFEIKHEAESFDALIDRYVENWITEPTREDAEIFETALEPFLDVVEKVFEGKFDELPEETQRKWKSNLKPVDESIKKMFEDFQPLEKEAEKRWKRFKQRQRKNKKK